MTKEERKNKGRQRRRRTALCGIALSLALLLTLSFARCGAQRSTQIAAPPAAEGESAAQTILPEGWALRPTAAGELAQGTLALVNREHGFDPELPETVSVYENKTDGYLVKDIYLSVRPDVMDALNQWLSDFAAETGRADVNVVAGWRSFDDQAALYRNAVDSKGQGYADAYLALPGHSEHHTGLAVDLDTYDLESGTSGDFDGRGVYAWAAEHAWEYGFVQRYPPEKSEHTGISYEPWHFRYVGLPHAYLMETEGLCLEEYIESLRGFPFSGEHRYAECQGRRFEIYFCPQEQLVVPTDAAYTVSGNNVDGFVVTVERP